MELFVFDYRYKPGVRRGDYNKIGLELYVGGILKDYKEKTVYIP